MVAFVAQRLSTQLEIRRFWVQTAPDAELYLSFSQGKLPERARSGRVTKFSHDGSQSVDRKLGGTLFLLALP